MRAKLLLAVSCLLWGSLYSSCFAWDGNWTDGESGQNYLYDKDNSTGKAGSDPPQRFLEPPPRDYMNVDPKELNDYCGHHKKDYTPYALLRVTQKISYGDVCLVPGYYQVKIGNWGEGSPNHTAYPPAPQAVLTLPPMTPQKSASQQPRTIPPEKLPPQRVFIFKHLGNVVAVLPIQQVTIYQPPRKDKIPKRALAWLEMENRRPVLKYYDKHWLFSTICQ